MNFQLQMLGTGGAFAKTYYNNNALLSTDDVTLLIDCGITAPASLYELGRTWEDIDAVLITHIHADHVGGLEELAFQMKYVYQRKPVLYIAETLAQPLWEHTLKGGLLQEGIDCLEDVFEVRLLQEKKTYHISEALTVEIICTPHIQGKKSYSLYLNNRIFYSADMRFQPQLIQELVDYRGCSSILHEVQLTGAAIVHTSLEELQSLPQPIQSMIRLMHYGDDMEQFREAAAPMTFLEQHKLYTF